jgi:hypothetical protein
MFLHLVETIERVKYVVLENCVEFVLHRCQESSCLKGVDTLIIPLLLPVEVLKVVGLELVENKHHSGNDFGLIEALSIHSKLCFWEHVFVGEVLVHDPGTFESLWGNDESLCPA